MAKTAKQLLTELVASLKPEDDVAWAVKESFTKATINAFSGSNPIASVLVGIVAKDRAVESPLPSHAFVPQRVEDELGKTRQQLDKIMQKIDKLDKMLSRVQQAVGVQRGTVSLGPFGIKPSAVTDVAELVRFEAPGSDTGYILIREPQESGIRFAEVVEKLEPGITFTELVEKLHELIGEHEREGKK